MKTIKQQIMKKEDTIYCSLKHRVEKRKELKTTWLLVCKQKKNRISKVTDEQTVTRDPPKQKQTKKKHSLRLLIFGKTKLPTTLTKYWYSFLRIGNGHVCFLLGVTTLEMLLNKTGKEECEKFKTKAYFSSSFKKKKKVESRRGENLTSLKICDYDNYN